MREELFLLKTNHIITTQGETSTSHQKVISILHIVMNLKEERIVSLTIRKFLSSLYPSSVLLDSRDTKDSNIKETHDRHYIEIIATRENLIIIITEITIIIEDIVTQVMKEEAIIRDMMIEITMIE